MAIDRLPVPARQALPLVANEDIPGSPEQALAYFRCGALRATMSGTACAARWRKLNGKDAPKDPSPCKGCDAGQSRDLYLVGDVKPPPPPADLASLEPKPRPVRPLPPELDALLDTPEGLRNRDVRRVLEVDNGPARQMLQAWCEAGLMVKVEAHKLTYYRRPDGGVSAELPRMAPEPEPEPGPKRKRTRRGAAGGKVSGAGWAAEHGVDWLAEARAAVAEWGADEDEDEAAVTGNVASEPAPTRTPPAHLSPATDAEGETMDEDLPEGVAALLDSRAGLTAASLRDLLGCSTSKGSRMLDGWVRAGLIERHGNGRYTFYRRPGAAPSRAQSGPTSGPPPRPVPTSSPVEVPALRPAESPPNGGVSPRPEPAQICAPSTPGKGLRVALEARVVRVGGLDPAVEVEVGGAVLAVPVTEEQAQVWVAALYQRRRLTLTLEAG